MFFLLLRGLNILRNKIYIYTRGGQGVTSIKDFSKHVKINFPNDFSQHTS